MFHPIQKRSTAVERNASYVKKARTKVSHACLMDSTHTTLDFTFYHSLTSKRYEKHKKCVIFVPTHDQSRKQFCELRHKFMKLSIFLKRYLFMSNSSSDVENTQIMILEAKSRLFNYIIVKKMRFFMHFISNIVRPATLHMH